MTNMTYKPPAVLPKTEYQRVKELKRMLVESKGERVVQKVIDIALDDKAKVNEGVAELRKSLTQEEDNAVAWRLLAEAYDKLGKDGLARLATAEYNFNVGDKRQARVFAMRAREMLDKGTPEWRRATDIFLVSEPSREEMRSLGREGLVAVASH